MPMRNKIKPFLSSMGITRYRFWKDTRIAMRTAYDLYEHPEQIPAGTVLEKICSTYQVQPGELLEWIPDETEAA